MDRFISKYEVDEKTGCWIWTSTTARNGYGRFQMGGRGLMAHRVAYELFVGPIPEGLVIDHLCRTRNCVNPGHLEAVTAHVNTLRGDTFQAKNLAKTHCPQGHALVEGNLDRSLLARGHRACRTCRNDRARNKYRAVNNIPPSKWVVK